MTTTTPLAMDDNPGHAVRPDALDRPAAPCVYFDGACPLCRAEIAAYQRAEGGRSIDWVDASAAASVDLGPGLDRDAALARLHVRRADGMLVQGAAAFVEIWSVLPRWRPLARVARVPGAIALMDLGYRAFLRVRPLWRRPVAALHAWPRAIEQDLRTDHAGETGAVMIYRGVLAVARDAALRDFAHHHLETEQRHLQLMEQQLPAAAHSRLLPMWRLSGWLTGALPACFGPRAVYATIQAVETFVDRHYAAQLDRLDGLLQDRGLEAAQRVELERLRALLASCQQDEVAHRDDAAARWGGRPRGLLGAWCALVGWGSDAAVRVCRHL